ncbi:hypothetical protein BGZ60DRAFT_408393 [Tricladium varicosporioides]|nr:hypothetical protein BGZ60DRAFT_408393 [Hymenoscyphus varicosporioides]
MASIIKYIFLFVTCFTVATAQSVAQVFGSLPACALNCTLPILLQSNCSVASLPDLASCLCPNFQAQRNISSCVQRSCNHTQQVVVVEVNKILCEGYAIPSRSEEFEIILTVLIAISAPFIILRILSRILVTRKLWWDDWTLAVASVVLLVTLAIEIPMARKGYGKHIWNLDPPNIPILQKLFYITQIFYICVQVLTKVSLLVCFLRIFPQRWFQMTTKVSIIAILIHGVIFIFVIAFQCVPVQSIWNPTIPAKCLNQSAIIFSGSAFSIFEDFLILIIPIPCIKDLKLKVGKRIIVGVMFSIGSFACITSMIRLKHLIGFGDFTDSSWDNMDTSIWSSIEIATAVICACLPALRPILMLILPKIFGKSTGGGTPDMKSPAGSASLDPGKARNVDSEKGNVAISSQGPSGEENSENEGSERGGRLSESSDQIELVGLKAQAVYTRCEKPLPQLPK